MATYQQVVRCDQPWNSRCQEMHVNPCMGCGAKQAFVLLHTLRCNSCILEEASINNRGNHRCWDACNLVKQTKECVAQYDCGFHQITPRNHQMLTGTTDCGALDSVGDLTKLGNLGFNDLVHLAGLAHCVTSGLRKLCI